MRRVGLPPLFAAYASRLHATLRASSYVSTKDCSSLDCVCGRADSCQRGFLVGVRARSDTHDGACAGRHEVH